MAANHTANYQLSQWEAADRIQREDFNADNAKIDAALKTNADAAAALQTALASTGNCKLYFGTYTGTGSGATTLTFEKRPLFVTIMGNNVWITAMQGAPVAIAKNAGQISNGYNTATWSGNSVSLTNGYDSMASQCNEKNIIYQVLALMDANE